MGKISGKQFQAVLESQLQNNTEEFRLVIKINMCARAILSLFFKCHKLLRGCIFRVKNAIDHQINLSYFGLKNSESLVEKRF